MAKNILKDNHFHGLPLRRGGYANSVSSSIDDNPIDHLTRIPLPHRRTTFHTVFKLSDVPSHPSRRLSHAYSILRLRRDAAKIATTQRLFVVAGDAVRPIDNSERRWRQNDNDNARARYKQDSPIDSYIPCLLRPHLSAPSISIIFLSHFVLYVYLSNYYYYYYSKILKFRINFCIVNFSLRSHDNIDFMISIVIPIIMLLSYYGIKVSNYIFNSM